MPTVIEASRKAEHVLGAGATFVHPTSGNAYTLACQKIKGVNQDLVVYRRPPPYDLSIPPEVIKVYDGAGADSDWQVTMGAAVILPTGSLYVAYSAVPKGDLPVPPDTGFVAIEDLLPGIDEPYPSLRAIMDELAALSEAGGATPIDPTTIAPVPALPLPLLGAFPNSGTPYANNHALLQNADPRLTDIQLLSAGWLYIRFNKLVDVVLKQSAVLAQHQERLRAIGVLT